ncbi:ABC transporter ATP-binding protein [Sutterella wadsworthensis]|uniref:ABC transporter ATP-binding protein n=1 Tax=Sutterella wadsworthensis TaxID=40545 RepID=UPI00242F0E7D|nr:ABC transporter ATP-binding protein [Sutterella wadsworthensis]
MPSAVTIKRLKKVVGGKSILKSIDLAVRPGEFLTLVGPSGCGKSTLLRVISGLTEFTSGSVLIDDKEVSELAPRERGVAMVFQSYALYPHMTVAENIATPLNMAELSSLERAPLIGRLFGAEKRRSIEDRVRAAARLVELEPYLQMKPSQLSGGQRQRVAIARAMVRRPGVFLMDEPLSNLDARLRTHMRGKIAELHQRLGATFIYVTHDQSEAMTLSDRIALMMEGEIIQLGTPDELYERPDNIRVAKFIGSPEINLLPDLVRSGRLIFNGQATALRIASPDSTVTIGIRAQRVHTADVDADGPLIQLTVHREETLGEDVLLYGETAVDGKSYPFVARASAKQTYQLRKESCSWNKPILLEAASSGVLVFDEQGERIVSRLNSMQEAA